jgi:hypothetical protein
MKTLPNSQETFLDATAFPLMSSQGDSRAKILALLESKQASAKAHDQGCGLNVKGFLASYDPNTQSLRTSQTCLVAHLSDQGDGLAEYSATWPKSGMMRSGTISHLLSLVAGPNGRELGYLPTPLKNSGNGAPFNRYFGSVHYRSNYAEGLRNGPDDPLYPQPDFAERVMGFPTGWTELQE